MTRFSTITPDDHSGYVWVASIYCIVGSTLVALTRAWIKRTSWGNDDLLFGAAFLAQLAHIIAIFVSLKDGLGQALPDHNTGSARSGARGTFAAQLTFVLALCFAKCSVLYFVQRLLSRDLRKMWSMCYFLIGLVSIWGLASVIGLSAGCQSSTFIYSPEETCPGQILRWQLVTAFDAITEVILMILPAFLVWPLQMSSQLKLQVVTAFIFRFPVLIFAILHALRVNAYVHSSHPNVGIASAFIYEEAELCWSLVSATIPNLKGFMKSFNTGFGLDIGITTLSNHGGYGSRNVGNSYQLSNLSHRKSNRPGQRVDSDATALATGNQLNPEAGEYSIEIGHDGNAGRAERESINSGKSQEMIIRKDITTQVDYKKRSKNLF